MDDAQGEFYPSCAENNVLHLDLDALLPEGYALLLPGNDFGVVIETFTI